MLKRVKVEGKVKNSTGFLIEAIKKNYANPEFSEEEKRKEARERGKNKQAAERKRQRLEEQKVELKKARDRNIHQLCEEMVKESPAILEEVMDAMFKEKPDFKKFYQPGKTSLENYQERVMFWVFVDPYLVQRAPERFQAVQDAYATQLRELGQEMAASEQTAA